MLNTTEIGFKLIEATQSEGMRILAEAFLPSFIFIFILIFALTSLMGVILLKKNFGNFLAIFLLPLIVTILLTFTFIFLYPSIPEVTGNWFEGVISKIIGQK